MLKQFTNKQILFVASAIATILLLVNSTPILERLELQHFTERQLSFYSDRSQSNITIVGLGRSTTGSTDVQRLFGKYPYARDFRGYLIRFFNRTQPKMVILDTAFELGSDLKNPKKDNLLAEAIKKAPYRVATAILDTNKPLNKDDHAFFKANQSTYKGKLHRLSAERLRNINRPYQTLIDSGAEFYPALFLREDINKTIRTTIPFVVFDKHNEKYFFPNLPLAPLLDESKHIEILENNDLKIGNRIINTYNRPSPIVRWYGSIRAPDKNPDAPTVYRRYETWDIVRNELILECEEDPSLPICKQADPETLRLKGPLIRPKDFKDKYILSGVTLENTDVHPAIYGSNYPGVYFQANILDNYLNNDFIKPSGPIFTYVFCVVLLLITSFLTSRRSIWTGLLFVGLLAGAYTYLTYYAYTEWALWLNWIYPITAIAVSTLGTLAYRLVKTQSRKEQLEVENLLDPLTSLYNKRYFNKTLKRQLEGAKALRTYLSLIFIDVDHFKQVNDKHGHNFGDEVLITISQTLKDIAKEHQVLDVCRYGGEEITVIVSNSPPETVNAMAEEMRKAVERIHYPSHPDVVITASFGVSTVHFVADRRHHRITQGQFIELSDRQVYKAKLEGRNCTCAIHLDENNMPPDLKTQ